MVNNAIIENAISNALELMDLYPRLKIEHQLTYDTNPKFSTKKGHIQCFIGTLRDKYPVMGCAQAYELNAQTAKNGHLLSEISINDFGKTNEKRGFIFEPLTIKYIKGQEEKELHQLPIAQFHQTIEWLRFKVHLHAFYEPMPMPVFAKKMMTNKFPMSAYVVFHDSLNRPIEQNKNTIGNFC